ncbi:nucleotide disphospho-sugar-binding domain-containing protein [Amycolatopsis sp. NPDC059027]|uniref:nucleotide disphospho-sugar-binding domain-containing protein n=1 Tax=unclassified Amycolatopsis TaxID=2618356 RepID=UPI003670686B
MRVLLTAPSSVSRLHGLVPLGWALRTGGHEVQIAGRPRFTEEVNRTGFVAVAVGKDLPDDAEDWLADPDAAAGLADYARRWKPDLVVWEEHAPAGAVAARVTGITAVRMLGLAPDRDRLAERLEAGLAVHGLSPDESVLTGRATLDRVPPSLRPEPGDGHVPLRYLPYSGPAVVPSWLRRKPRRQRILLTLAEPAAAPAALFDAIAELDAEVICELPAKEVPAGARVPANLRLFDSVPVNAVLGTCSAVVHDGSSTTAITALAHALPQCVVSAVPEKDGSSLAHRIAGQGAAVLAGRGEDAAVLAERIGLAVSDDAVREAVGRLHTEMAAMPSPHELRPELVRLGRAER